MEYKRFQLKSSLNGVPAGTIFRQAVKKYEVKNCTATMYYWYDESPSPKYKFTNHLIHEWEKKEAILPLTEEMEQVL